MESGQNVENPDTGLNTLRGIGLVAFMLIMVGIMFYFLFFAPKSAPLPAFSPIPEETGDPFAELNEESEEEKNTGEKPEAPADKSPTPRKEPGRKPQFTPPPPDGPPLDMKKADSDLFDGKTGKAEIIIHSTAFPARIYLADMMKEVYWELEYESTGENTYQLSIPPGGYKLKIVKPGYISFDELFEAGDGESAEIPSEPLVKRPSLALKSEPDTADIYLNNLYAGQTPMTISDLDVKTYRITMKKSGFKDISFDMNLQPGKTAEKTAVFK